MADDVQFQSAALATPPATLKVATDNVAGHDYQKMKLADGTADSEVMAKVNSEGNLQTITPNRTASGTLGALNDAVTISDTSAMGTVAIFATANSSFVGTVIAEGSPDGSNWFYITAFDQDFPVQTNTLDPTPTAGVYQVDATSFSAIRVRVSAYTSGSAAFTLRASAASPSYGVPRFVYIADVNGSIVGVGDGTSAKGLRITSGSDSPDVTSLALIDDSVHTDDAARGKSLLMGAVLDDVAPTAITENQVGYLRMSSARRLLTDASGTTQPVSAASLPLPTGAATLTEQQTQTTSLQLIDDVVHASDAALGKVAAVGAQFDDTTPGTTTENNVRPLRMSTRRELYSQIRDAAGNERGANVSAGNALLVDASATTQPVSGTVTANQGTAGTAWEVIGDVAHDAAAPTNPVLVGAQMETMADSAPGTRSSTDGDSTKFATADGALFVIPSGAQIFTLHATGVQTGAQVHAAPGAGLSCYISSISFSIGAATASSVKVLNNGGADIWGPHYLEAINGRGMHVTFPTPLKAAANGRLDVTTTGAATQTVDIEGYIAPG